jgi:MFS family permease
LRQARKHDKLKENDAPARSVDRTPPDGANSGNNRPEETAMAVSAAAAGPSGMASRQSLSFIIGASSVGTLIEWYDFYLYGVLAVFFSKHFFASSLDPTVALIASFAVFWTGFLVRPFGAIVFGHLGDLIGRKFTFMLTLLLMGASTFVVGLLPGYDTLGALAPLLLVAMRVLQGLALGGEYGGAATYIAEHAPDSQRGYYTSWIQTTATMGIVLALLVILICRLSLGDQVFADWGWRVPFLISAALVLLSIYIRLKLEESPLYERLKSQGKASRNPALESFGSGRNWGLILLALFGATAPEGVVWYTGQFYALFYMTTVLKINFITVYVIMMIALTAAAPFFIVFGALSDRIGRRNIMTLGFALAVVTYWPVFTWLGTFKDNPVILGLLVFYMVILVTMVYGPIAAYLVELFPARIRYTSMSLPYHVGNGVFGGLVPLAGASIAAYTGIALSGLFYPMGIAALGVIVSLAAMREPTHNVKIWDEVGGPPLVPDQP